MKYPAQWTSLLPKEAARWEHEGIISPEQRERIVALYPAADQRERFVGTLPLLGALLVGAGVILWHAANWPVLPTWLKVAEIFSLILASYAAGYHLQYRRDYPRLGHGLIFLGALLYGAGIWLVAQIFHIDSHYPNGFLFWGLGVIPLAWITRSQPLLLLSTVLMTVWTGSEQFGFDRQNWLFLLLALAPLLPLAHRLESWWGTFLVLGGTAFWLMANAAAGLRGGGENVALTLGGVYAALLVTVGLALQALRRNVHGAYLLLGAFGIMATLYPLTFDYEPEPFWPHFANPGVGTLTAALVISLGLAAWYAWRAMGDKQKATALVGTALIAAAAQFALPAMAELPRIIVANLLLFGLIIGVIYTGFRMQSRSLVNLGLLAFVIDLITRYVDLFFNMMDRSLFFIIGGLMLLGGGLWLERNRRKWMRDWGADE